MIRCNEMALKIKVVVGDDEDDGGGDGTAWTEPREEKNPQTHQKTTVQPKTCLCASETKHRGLFQRI